MKGETKEKKDDTKMVSVEGDDEGERGRERYGKKERDAV